MHRNDFDFDVISGPSEPPREATVPPKREDKSLTPKPTEKAET